VLDAVDLNTASLSPNMLIIAAVNAVVEWCLWWMLRTISLKSSLAFMQVAVQ